MAWLASVGALSAGEPVLTLTDATAAAGLEVNHSPDWLCIGPQTWMTGGMAAGDFDNDGSPDLFLASGGLAPDRLFINDGRGTFTDEAAAWGVAEYHGGNGVAVGDYDRNGWLDIYVTSFGTAGAPGQPGQHRLYRNNGAGSFTEVAATAGVNRTTTDVANGYGAAFGDYDLDGHLDLFVASWKDVAGAGNEGTGNRLFHNNGDGTFSDVTELAIGDALAGVWGFQPAFVDMDGDRYPEILLAADFETSRFLANERDGTFSDRTSESGTGLDDNGMGHAVADLDNDGLLDWYVTSIHKDFPSGDDYPGNMLYRNLGRWEFSEVSHRAGVNDGGWGWGVVAVDLDQDGWTDLVEVNGRASANGEWNEENAKLFRNEGNGTFTEQALACGLDRVGQGRSIVTLDADRDGDRDLALLENDGGLYYYRNDTVDPGNWLRISMRTNPASRNAPNGFGAHVTAWAGDRTYVRYLDGSPSYLATSELTVHFGLGDAELVERLRIRWPDGKVTVLRNVPVNRFLEIRDSPSQLSVTP